MSERSSTDLCGGRLATAVPTAIRPEMHRLHVDAFPL